MTRPLFRHHDTAPAGVISPLYRQLTQEWADLHALPSTRITVRRWGRSEEALADCATPGEVVDAIDHATTANKNAMLLALIRLFQNGQQLAGRTVLQALLPKLAKTSSHVSDWAASTETWSEDRRHITLAEFWDVMATYPVERRLTSVASNLALDTLHRITGVRTSVDIPVDPHDFREDVDRHQYANAARRTWLGALSAIDDDPFAELTCDADLLQVIKWAMDAGIVTTEDAQLLTISYLPERTTGFGYAEAADHFDITQDSARQRCSRLSRKITAAVRDQLTHPDGETRPLEAQAS